ncbi:M23 family metallopeptidase [Nonomuraea typhae]|uniref:M23 family metallopeptidase n=1 Tax=Nonomuraea typhae TaxID=2603600 RepID=UPI0012F8F95C|nr:M23 family metallopeptidase [Nonomuraea typhae]
MRSGHFGRLNGWAAVAGALLAVAGCAQGTGVAGVSASAPATVRPSAVPEVTGTIPPLESQSRPQAEAPVKVPPPKLSKYEYVFPVKDCKTTYQRRLLMLPKTTVWAAQGCAFVAPIGGVVDEVNAKNRWRPSTDKGADREGRFVTIIGDDGVRYLGGHLDSVAEGLAPGVKVKAGQVLGRVGKSGNARDTGANLYFAISWKTGPAYWWVRRGMVEPWDYLDAWATGNKTYSPRDATFDLRKRLGETPPCRVQCKDRAAPQPTNDDKKPKEDEEPPVIIGDPTTTPATRL